MPEDKPITTLETDLERFQEWWNEQKILGINPVIVFNHIEKFFKPQWQSQQKETKPVEDKAEKKYSYKITEHESYIIAYKVNTFEERTIAICDNAEKADFICKALNLCSNNPELLETQKPVSEEGWISVEERLPDEECQYLCCNQIFIRVENKYYNGMFLSNFKFYSMRATNEIIIDEDGITGCFQDNNAYAQIVTHWQPLPKPPITNK